MPIAGLCSLSSLQPPTLAETLEVQSDLKELCRDRELISNEIFTPNSFYGQDFVLKRYAQLPEDRPLYCVAPHGADLELTLIWQPEYKADLPVILGYSEARRHAYRSVTRKVVVPSASPYVYATRLLEQASERPRAGTIFFLSHSTHHLIENEDAERVARKLQKVDECWRPITICVYWKDFLLGRHEPFLKRGFPIVSAGHIFDPLFLFRLHHLCSVHQFSSGNKVGSHVFCSVHSGCEHVYFSELGPPPPFGLSKSDKRHELIVVEPTSGLEVPDLSTIFLAPEIDREKQGSAAAYFLGCESATSSEELRVQLRGWESVDRFGYWRAPTGEIFRYLPPTAYLRSARRTARALRRVLPRDVRGM